MLRTSSRMLPRLSIRSISKINQFHSRPRTAAQSLASTSTVHTPINDLPLLQIFDSPDFNNSSPNSSISKGLFSQPSLQKPSDFLGLAKRTILGAKVIVAKICQVQEGKVYNSLELVELEFLTMVKDLDRLSDRLCSVIDLAELVRNVHPEEAWTEGANAAYEELCGYMNVLNTHVGLYQALKSLHILLPLSTPSKSAKLYAAYAVALPFLRDFEKSGIHLPTEQRNQFVELSTEIIQLGRKFLQNSSEVNGEEVNIKYDEIEEAMGSGFADRVFRNGKGKKVNSASWEGRVIARQHPSEEIRKKLFIASNTAKESHVEILEELLMTRAELADLVGRESWGDVSLDDKMAKTPENVMGFLNELNRVNLPLAKKDIEILKAAKKSHTGAGRFTGVTINAWDRDFYTDYSANTSNLPDISPFFSVGTCFQGLSKLFTSLYGIRFEIESLTTGEAWNGQVRKLKVIDEDQGRIGTIYCDLFARTGKPPGAAHYTVRCSRRIDDDNERGDFEKDGLAIIEGVGISPQDIQGLNVDGVKWRGREGIYQEPIIALVCGFGSENQQNGPALLQWHEVETLFHEMGHAIHSMIGRTDYHNVSGTRCATDFVELPSILMEHFLASPQVLSTFAKHHSSGQSIPPFLISQLMKERKRFSALETSTQIMMATLDQEFHSKLVISTESQSSKTGRFDSEKVLKKVQLEFNILPHVEGTNFTPTFGHLFGYGSTYYSYLFDRAIASEIFKQKFQKDSLSRERGEEFKQGVLQWGGGKDSWEMVGGLIDDETVMAGGKKAMEIVGQWGIKDD